MKDKLQEAAEAYVRLTYGQHTDVNIETCSSCVRCCIEDFKAGFEQAKQQIEQLQKERYELLKALEDACDTHKDLGYEELISTIKLKQ